MGEPQSSHGSVLLSEVLDALAPLEGARIVDGTFGARGHARALAARGARVVALDRVPTVIAVAERLAAAVPDNFTVVAGPVAALDTLAGDEPVDGVVLDIGVSSMQLDQAERGFSFMR